MKEIISFVDIHSPTAGNLKIGRGIDIYKISKERLTNFSLIHFEICDHCSISSKNKIIKILSYY
ncbi:MAG: hypothetical protein ACTSXT_06120 [Candidatus Helarchaeota archaeon]